MSACSWLHRATRSRFVSVGVLVMFCAGVLGGILAAGGTAGAAPTACATIYADRPDEPRLWVVNNCVGPTTYPTQATVGPDCEHVRDNGEDIASICYKATVAHPMP